MAARSLALLTTFLGAANALTVSPKPTSTVNTNLSESRRACLLPFAHSSAQGAAERLT